MVKILKKILDSDRDPDALQNEVFLSHQQWPLPHANMQGGGRLLHINDGANAPWKSMGKRFAET